MARTFGGVSTDRVVVGNYAAINSLDTLTMSIWAKQTSTAGSGSERFLDKFEAGTFGSSAFLWLPVSNTNTVHWGTARWQVQQGRWTVPYTADTTAWHHHAVTYSHSATTNDPVMYVDGTSGTVTETITPDGSVLTETLNLTIGNRSAADRVALASLADVAIWNMVLSGANITSLAAGADPRTIESGNLVFFMPLCGVVSPEPNLSSPSDTGTVTGTVSLSPHPTAFCDSPSRPMFRGS